MGVLVQREFTVGGDDRAEFERQSREGVWENMRFNGAQMIAFGSWAFGAPGDVVVTHSVYADFDHWTATRPWGAFTTDAERGEETRQIRAVFAGRPRLIAHSRASIIDYDSEVSEPAPFYRHQADEPSTSPPTYGRQSIIAETRHVLTPGSAPAFRDHVQQTLGPWLADQDARLVLYGTDPLTSAVEVITLMAFRSISDWHRLSHHAIGHPSAERLVTEQRSRLLMVQTDFGHPV